MNRPKFATRRQFRRASRIGFFRNHRFWQALFVADGRDIEEGQAA